MKDRVEWEPVEGREDKATLDRAWDEAARREGVYPPVSVLSEKDVRKHWEALIAAGRSPAPKKWIEALHRRMEKLKPEDGERLRDELNRIL